MAGKGQAPAGEQAPRLLSIREDPGSQAAVLFVHGFTGRADTTWGAIPEYLAADPRLNGWNLYSLGYRTDLRVDVPGIWKAKPDLAKLATLLRTASGRGALGGYKVLSFVAHSMGGLVVQRALVDDEALAGRTRHVALFGTPSGGLRKAGWIALLNRQVGDMKAGGPFIEDLRSRWTRRFGGGSPFDFLAAAGDEDEFVPADSSLEPFPEDQRAVVYGGHLEIVKPESPDDLSVQMLSGFLAGEGAPAGPWNSARIAVERQDFQTAVDRLWPHRAELDDRNLVHLALALETVGQQEDAFRVLEEHAQRADGGTDPLGVLAGRLKRRWLAEGRKKDADRALDLYRQGLEKAAAADDHGQAFYHAINVAFLELAYRDDPAAARERAETALTHCDRHAETRGENHWSLATRGEARLVLGDDDEALAAYREAVEQNPSPRELDSMYRQAVGVAELLGRNRTAERLEALFRAPLGGGESPS